MTQATAKSALPKRRLGRTDMDITPVGLGAWAIGGSGWTGGWGEQDDKASIAAIRHAAARGLNWIDTAAVYGLGHSEAVVGTALKDIPASERPLVFTKCGPQWDESNRMAPPRSIGEPASIHAQCEASLKRLGVERIDLLQMHWPAQDGASLADYWGAMQELKRQGKVRAVGLSNHNTELLEAAEAIGHVDTLQPPFSAIRRDFAGRELPWCVAHDTGVIVYSPMQAGLLTGAFTAERAAKLPADDWRSRSAEFTGDKLKSNLALADTMKAIAARHGTTTASVAIAWTLAWPGVSGAIVGARSPDQIDGWVDAASLTLAAADLDEIAATIKREHVGTGPALAAETVA